MGGTGLTDIALEARAKSPSQSQRAVQQLREMIITNQLPAGSNVLEPELAQMLNMSRTPIREAAIILEAQGLVEIKPRRGIRIVPLSPEDMEEIYSILTELESLAAYKAAETGISATDMADMQRLIDEMDEALQSDDRKRWAIADGNFHRKLVSLANNRRLQSIVATYSDQVHRARMMTLFIRPAPHQSNTDHRKLVEAIAARDPEAARNIHHAHRKGAKDLMIQLIKDLGFSSV
ncbi:MAG: GntR family transcriptional regulator [Stappiaceae bacterium]